MKKVIPENNIPIKLWLDGIEQGALDQAKNLANLPFAFKHIAIMSDAHQGYGMPIGGVLATKDVVIPNAVGVDISCGMQAVKTSLTDVDKDTLIKIIDNIREYIPVGFHKQKEKKPDSLMPKTTDEKYNLDLPIVSQLYDSALYQLGTLGGGNHFIEIQKGNDGFIWLMVHSGSRNLGFRVANHYNKLAISLNKKWHTKIPEEWDLAFLPIESPEGSSYLSEMRYCADFALANRSLMIDKIKSIIITFNKEKAYFDKEIDVSHNYAAIEGHFSKLVMIHRKGATRAFTDDIGIIPGSQGSKSYIVEGLGNPESFRSCSHGAGRIMSRTKAKAELNLKDEIKILNDQGIIHGIKSNDNLDEATGAYKDIATVMENQADLVKIKVELSPLAVVKDNEKRKR